MVWAADKTDDASEENAKKNKEKPATATEGIIDVDISGALEFSNDINRRISGKCVKDSKPMGKIENFTMKRSGEAFVGEKDSK
jgi:hypothetical protein